MKRIISLLIIVLPLFLFSQENSEYFAPVEQLDVLIDKYSNSEYEEAFEIIEQITRNDSLYYTYYFIKTSIYFDQEEYEEVIKLCDEIDEFNKHDMAFRLKKGVSLLRLERFEEAKNYFAEILETYPVSHIAYFNKGIANYYLDDYESAVKDYQQSIILNPYYAAPHFELAKICYNEHLVSQAVLCLNSYLLIDPTAGNALNVLSFLNTIVSEKNESEMKGIEISEDDSSFEEIDLLIMNYTALNDKYKISNDLDLPLVKQNQALMEMLQYYEGNGGFWDRKYIPFYKEIFDSGKFDAFIYQIMSSTTNEKYIKVVNKHDKDVEEFINWAGPLWTNNIRSNNSYKELEDVSFSYYDDGECSAISKEDENENFVGDCYFFYEDGNLKTEGHYVSAERDGEWTWYFENGMVDEKLSFVDGKPEGLYLQYNEKGNIIGKTEYKNGEINGLEILYNEFGVQQNKSNYIDGKANGLSYTFHDLGEDFIASEIPFTNDEIDGEARTFYSKGQEKLKVEIRNGSRVGTEYHYYENGQLKQIYEYVDGNINCDFKKYYDTGQLMEEGKFVDNFRSGEWKTYYSNGKIENIINYNDKGEFDGVYDDYHKNGKLNSKYYYNNGKFLSCTFFNADENIIKEIKANNKAYDYEAYYLNGNLRSQGVYHDNSKKEGEWNYYNQYGQLTSKEFFEGGKLSGIDYEYYPDNSVSSETIYIEGSANGEYKSFYINGTLKGNGIYKDDNSYRVWISYYADGTTSEKLFFIDDMVHGTQYNYSVDGKLFNEEYWENDNHISSIYYDTAGGFIEKIDYYKDRTGSLHYTNGKVKRSYNYLNGNAHGEFIWYHINGQIETKGNLFDGKRTGDWVWYFDDGQLFMKGNYISGLRDGEWTTYYENGQLSYKKIYKKGDLHGPYYSYTEEGILDFETNYYDGNLHGISKFYNEQGDLQAARYYEYGSLYAYSYPDENGELLPEIPLKDGTGRIATKHSSGIKSRDYEMYKGEIHGEYLSYHRNGELASISTYTYGVRNGKSEDYYETGQLKEKYTYLNDEIHGELLKYYSSGQLKEKEFYRNGSQSGPAEYYYPDGKLKKKIFYFNGYVYDATYFE